MYLKVQTTSFYWETPEGRISRLFNSLDSAVRSANRKHLVFYKIKRLTTIEYTDEVYTSYDTF